MIEENIHKYEIRLDPIDFHPGLREQIDAFQNRIKEERPGAKLAKKLEEKLAKRFCHVCFFGKVEGVVMGEPMCEECARELYGITKDGKWNCERLGDLSRQIWYRKLKALPVFEAYLQAELRSWEAELKLEEYMHGKGNKE